MEPGSPTASPSKGDFAAMLATIDVSSPFVAVTVDSHKINVAISTLLQCIRGLEGNVKTLTTTVDAQAMAAGVLERRLAATNEHVATAEATLITLTAAHDARLKTLESAATDSAHKIGGLEERVRVLEGEKIDPVKVEKAIRDAASALDVATKQEVAVGNVAREVAAVTGDISEASRGLDALYHVLEMDRGAVAALHKAADPSKDAATTLTKCGAFVVNLPPFRHLARLVQANKDEARQQLVAGIEDVRNLVMDEVATVTVQLQTKVDNKVFNQYQRDSELLARKLAALQLTIDRVHGDVEAVLPKTEGLLVSVRELNAVKADRAQLLGLASADDILALEKKFRELQDLTDSFVAKFNLELHEHAAAAKKMQQAQRSAAPLAAPPAADDGASTPNVSAVSPSHVTVLGADGERLADLLKRLIVVEDCCRDLDERKADKADLAQLHADLEAALQQLASGRVHSSRRPSSATERQGRPGTPSELPSRRVLTPIDRSMVRPDSATGRATIPENSRPPSPMFYTSMPVPREQREDGHSPGRSTGASAQLFDANGNRTLATLGAAVAVPAIEHWQNMGNAAGDVDVPIPAGFIKHQVS
jgi:hypothetical protein